MSPVVVDRQGVAVGAFELRSERKADDPSEVDRFLVCGVGLHLGPAGLALGLLRWETVVVEPTPGGVVLRTDWITAMTGDKSETHPTGLWRKSE